MNTHQKVFFTCAVSLGFVAAAFSATPAPVVKAAAPIELQRVTVIGHRNAPIALQRVLVIGHRSEVLVASNNSNKAFAG